MWIKLRSAFQTVASWCAAFMAPRSGLRITDTAGFIIKGCTVIDPTQPGDLPTEAGA